MENSWFRFFDVTNRLVVKWSVTIIWTLDGAFFDQPLNIYFWFLQALKAVGETETLNEKAKEAMAKGDLETAQTLYSKYMTVLDEYLSPPYPDYYKTQQHIWKCIWMRFGNRVIRGKLPQAPSNDFDSVDWVNAIFDSNLYVWYYLQTQ